MIELHLLRPLWLLAFIPLAVLIGQLSKPAIFRSSWSRVCDPHLLAHIIHQPQQLTKPSMPWLVTVSSSLLILAMAGPVWQRMPQPIFNTQSALVLLLDLSQSMDATDLKPSRLTRAKHKIIDILRKHREGQTALLVFANEPFVVTPLTNDTATVTALLSSLDTSLMPNQGSRADRAVEKAAELLHQGGISHGNLLLLTDEWRGDNLAVQRLVTAGHTLSILGVGTEEGAPIPQIDGGFLKQTDDTMIIAKLDKAFLHKVAQQGGGSYQTIQTSDRDIEALLSYQDKTRSIINNNNNNTKLITDVWREEGPWIVLLALPLVALAFRRGVLILLPFWLLIPAKASAWDWESLWYRSDQQAMRLFSEGKMAESALVFEDQHWKAVAYYRAGQFQKAILSLQKDHSTKALYNKANALAKLGQLEEAVRVLKKVIQDQPNHEDAHYNLERILEALQSSGKKATDTEKANKPINNRDQKSASNPSINQKIPTKNQKPSEEETDEQQQEQQKESQLAKEQWLRRIPDDPGGLLRRKFRYQYQSERLYEKSTITQDIHPW